MATLEKFFCLFALGIALLMSLLLGVVLSSVPVPRAAAEVSAPRPDGTLLQREPDLRPRLPESPPS